MYLRAPDGLQAVNTVSKSADPLTRDRGFESGSIQRGVRCERGWKPSESKRRVGTFNGIGDHPLLEQGDDLTARPFRSCRPLIAANLLSSAISATRWSTHFFE